MNKDFYEEGEPLDSVMLETDTAWRDYLREIQNANDQVFGQEELAQGHQNLPQETGKIGIFWIYAHQLCGRALAIKAATFDQGLFRYPGLHADEYQDILPASVEDWGDIPRGRIIYDFKARRFKVASSSGVIASFRARNLILAFFNLPKNRTDWATDEQYLIDAELDLK